MRSFQSPMGVDELINYLSNVTLHGDTPRCIRILESELGKGFEFNDFNVDRLVQTGNPELIKYYLDRKTTPVSHLLSIFVHSGYSYKGNEILNICINHGKFPKNQKDFFADCFSCGYTGYSSFLSACKKYLRYAYCVVVKCKAIKLFFEKFPDLINASEISFFQNILIHVYQAEAKTEEEKNLVKEALLVVCKHPQYIFLKEQKYVLEDGNDFLTYPFYWAAITNDKNLFNLFYFHEDTSHEARKRASAFAMEHNNPGLLEEIARQLVKLRQERAALTFYIGMMNDSELLNVQDVIFQVLDKLIKTEYYDSLTLINDEKHEEIQQDLQKNKFSFFQEGPISDDRLIEIIKVGVNNYLDSKGKPSSDGLHRANVFMVILGNKSLSFCFKMLTTYAVLNEKTWCESRIKVFLNDVIKKYLDIVNKTANGYAQENNFDLSLLTTTLMSRIYKNNSEYFNCDEKVLLGRISKGAKLNSHSNSKKT